MGKSSSNLSDQMYESGIDDKRNFNAFYVIIKPLFIFIVNHNYFDKKVNLMSDRLHLFIQQSIL